MTDKGYHHKFGDFLFWDTQLKTCWVVQNGTGVTEQA